MFFALYEILATAALTTNNESVGHQTTLVECQGMVRAVMEEEHNNITNTMTRWVAENSQLINIVINEGL